MNNTLTFREKMEMRQVQAAQRQDQQIHRLMKAMEDDLKHPILDSIGQ